MATVYIDADDRDGYFDGTDEIINSFGSFHINKAGALQLDACLMFQLTGPASGDTIDTSLLSIYAWKADNPSSATVHGADVDNAAVLVDAHTHDCETHFGALTSASVAWTIPSVAGWKQSPSLVTIVQEIVNRPGWVSGNYVAFRIRTATGYNAISCDDFAGSDDFPFLEFTYTPAAAGGVQRTGVMRGILRGESRGMVKRLN